jgi:hypothetical protein
MPRLLSMAVLIFLVMTALWAHIWDSLDLFQVKAWLGLAGLSAGVARRHTQPVALLTSPRRQRGT